MTHREHVALTRFYFEVDGLTIQGEGVVQVTGTPDGDPGPAIAAFLANMDPQLVEQLALQRDEPGKLLSACIIEVLAELAVGKAPGG